VVEALRLQTQLRWHPTNHCKSLVAPRYAKTQKEYVRADRPGYACAQAPACAMLAPKLFRIYVQERDVEDNDCTVCLPVTGGERAASPSIELADVNSSSAVDSQTFHIPRSRVAGNTGYESTSAAAPGSNIPRTTAYILAAPSPPPRI